MATFNSRIVLDPHAVHRLLTGPDGPVYRRLLEDGEIVKDEARRRVGVHKPDPWGRPTGRRPGQLRDTIVKRMVEEGGAPAVLVGSEDPIALPHHEGTNPHTIRATSRSGFKPGGVPHLVFWVGGQVMAKVSVLHPGTRPNRFLTDAIDALRRRY